MRPTILCALLVLPLFHALASYGTLLKTYNFAAGDMVRDPIRDIMYCTVPETNSVAAIDTNTLEVIATIYCGSNPAALDVTQDGNLLFVANSGSTTQGIAKIDLQTFTLLGYIATTQNCYDVAAGSDKIVYTRENQIRAYNTETGAVLSGAPSGVFIYSGKIALSPDRKTLFYYQSGLSPSTWYKLDVTQWPATVSSSGTYGSNGSDFALSADGQFITFASGAPYSVDKLSSTNPTSSFGTFNTGAYPRSVTYSADGSTLFATHTSGHIDAWDAATYVLKANIILTGEAYSLLTDRKSRVLFAGDIRFQSPNLLRAFFIGQSENDVPLNTEILRAVEITWDSEVGQLYQVQWRQLANDTLSWQDLGSPILGNGLRMSVFDKPRDFRAKFYRVTKVSP
ncbi:MAG: YncE family protein [Candidatus Methylacidiphilales bacterium]|nr:YncE family protein [Candidatus Methylacidiphilales bacterium]